MSFLIFKCSSCSKLNISPTKQKTKLCVFCGRKNDLRKVKILGRTLTSREAKEAISSLKFSAGKH